MTQRNTEKVLQMNTLDQKKTLSQAVSCSRRNTVHNWASVSRSSTDKMNRVAVDSECLSKMQECIKGTACTSRLLLIL